MEIKRAFAWEFLGTTGGAILNFLIGIALARILAPEDFGLLGAVMIFIGIATTLSEGGILLALIRMMDVSDDDRKSAFFLNLFLGLSFFLIFFIVSPSVDNFFNFNGEIIAPLRYASLAIIFTSLNVVPTSILVSETRFDILAKANLISAFLSGVIGVSLAIMDFGIWALLNYQVSKSFLILIIVAKKSSWRFNGDYSFEGVKRLVSFSGFLVLGSLFSTIQQKINYFIIGKVFSASTLGYYNRAENINSFSTSIVTASFQKIFIPFYAKSFKNEGFNLNSLKRVNQGTFLLSSFLILFIASSAENLVVLLLGEKWSYSGQILMFLGLSSLFTSMNGLNRDILVTSGYSKLLFQNQLIKLLAFLPGFLIAYFHGISYFLLYNVLVSLFAIYINGRKAKEIAGYSLKLQVKDILPNLIIGLFCALSVYAISNYIELEAIIMLFLQFSIYVCLYLLLSYVFKLNAFLDVSAALRKITKD